MPKIQSRAILDPNRAESHQKCCLISFRFTRRPIFGFYHSYNFWQRDFNAAARIAYTHCGSRNYGFFFFLLCACRRVCVCSLCVCVCVCIPKQTMAEQSFCLFFLRCCLCCLWPPTQAHSYKDTEHSYTQSVPNFGACLFLSPSFPWRPPTSTSTPAPSAIATFPILWSCVVYLWKHCSENILRTTNSRMKEIQGMLWADSGRTVGGVQVRWNLCQTLELMIIPPLAAPNTQNLMESKMGQLTGRNLGGTTADWPVIECPKIRMEIVESGILTGIMRGRSKSKSYLKRWQLNTYKAIQLSLAFISLNIIPFRKKIEQFALGLANYTLNFIYFKQANANLQCGKLNHFRVKSSKSLWNCGWLLS